MKETVKFYVIEHKTGAHANQIEKFDFDKHQEISLGRALTNDVKFDSEQDIMVSREHAKIVKNTDDPLSFSIVDNKSKNGVWVNKKKVLGSVALNPGDVIELGKGGPSFVFDLDPRPKAAMAATRVMDVPKATQEIKSPQEAEAPKKPEKVGIGKQTFERAIAAEQKKSNTKMIAGLVAALMVIGAVAYVIIDKTATDIGTSISKVEGKIPELPPEPTTLKPTEISSRNSDKVVQIEGAWEIYDPVSGDQVWHQYVPIIQPNGTTQFVAAYILNAQGEVEPYLARKTQIERGMPVASSYSGSGFVVSASGFILTNRHVASGWNSVFTFPEFAFPGILLSQNGQVTDQIVQKQDVGTWIPSETSLFHGVPVQQKLIGRNTTFNVVFAETAARREAKINLISDQHDAALIKVDFPGDLPYVELFDNYNEIKPGQDVTVIGYPGVSPQMLTVRRSSDGLKPSPELKSVPSPTISVGHVGRALKWNPENINLYSTFGDTYQLTINSTGAGNSGGPMFDDHGRVIGIFYATGKDAGGTMVTYAVPIKYGLELLGHTKVN